MKRKLTEEQRVKHMVAERLRRKTHPEKCKAAEKKWRDKDPEKRKRLNRERIFKKREIFQEKANAYKILHGCIDCGYKESALALQFDHVYGEKVKQVSLYDDWEKAQDEVSKCVIRCANCHMIKTFKRKRGVE